MRGTIWNGIITATYFSNNMIAKSFEKQPIHSPVFIKIKVWQKSPSSEVIFQLPE